MPRKGQKITTFPITKLVPNIITITGLCFGLFAIKHAMAGNWHAAVMLIVLASFLDGFDGGVARLLNASSKFGAQLDSLADFLNFSIAPALTLYLWKTHEIKGMGWAIAIFFILCGAIRLARFNAMMESKTKQDSPFFLGLPAPSAAGLSLLPMIITFFSYEKFGTMLWDITPAMVIIHMAVIAVLMVSRMPTLSIKQISIRKEFSSLLLASAALFIIALITEPWVTLPLLGMAYMLTIPYCLWRYHTDRST